MMQPQRYALAALCAHRQRQRQRQRKQWQRQWQRQQQLQRRWQRQQQRQRQRPQHYALAALRARWGSGSNSCSRCGHRATRLQRYVLAGSVSGSGSSGSGSGSSSNSGSNSCSGSGSGRSALFAGSGRGSRSSGIGSGICSTATVGGSGSGCSFMRLPRYALSAALPAQRGSNSGSSSNSCSRKLLFMESGGHQGVYTQQSNGRAWVNEFGAANE